MTKSKKLYLCENNQNLLKTMYLAPLNYDRYFKKVFSDIKIAKRFLEDFLDITILELSYLQEKKILTDDAQAVEFDFRCKTPEGIIIIEMQQWHKLDVVQRMYVYHALGSALQLEEMPKKVIPLPEGKTRNVRDYSELAPTITIIWMVHDTFYFTEDLISYVLTPEYVIEFLHDSENWNIESHQMLLDKRERLLKILDNTSKNLDFLAKNKLIYAFQKNIVRNQKFSKYYAWFELAEKTLKKISEKFEYDKYMKDEILSEVIRKLKQGLSEADSEGYIKNYEEYQDGVLRFERGIKNNVLKEVESKVKEAEGKAKEAEGKAKEAEGKAKEAEGKVKEAEGKAKEAEGKVKEAEGKAKEAEGKVTEAKAREKEERRQKEEERRQKEEERRQKEEAKAKLHSTIKKLKISGMEVNEIADITGETEEEILKILKS